jgi:hypothetical protein
LRWKLNKKQQISLLPEQLALLQDQHEIARVLYDARIRRVVNNKPKTANSDSKHHGLLENTTPATDKNIRNRVTEALVRLSAYDIPTSADALLATHDDLTESE